MKYFLTVFFLLFLTCGANAQKNYSLENVTLHFDANLGTFIHNTVTYGYIWKGSYVIKIIESTTESICYYKNEMELVTPLDHFPTILQMHNQIKEHAINNGLKDFANVCIDSIDGIAGQSTEDAAVNMPELNDMQINVE